MVVNGGHKETLAFHVDAGVIDASFDIRQGDMGCERQGLLPGGQAIQQEQCCDTVFHFGLRYGFEFATNYSFSSVQHESEDLMSSDQPLATHEFFRKQ